MKRIFKDKKYRVEKITENEYSDLGILSGDDVHLILKGFTYNTDFNMYFDKSVNVGYSINPV